MDKFERLQRVAQFLGGQFSCGENSISRDDMIGDGVSLRTELKFAVSAFGSVQLAELGATDLVTGLSDILSTWSGGFELASKDDFVTEHDTLEDVVFEYLERLEAQASPALAP